MKKIIVCLVLLLTLIVGGICGYLTLGSQDIPKQFEIKYSSIQGQYIVKKTNEILKTFLDEEAAIKYAKNLSRVTVVDLVNKKWVYSSYDDFLIFDADATHDFNTFELAYKYAKSNGFSEIYYQDEYTIIWKEGITNENEVILNVPLIKQYPELGRGCEVTSLAMLLAYHGKVIDKMTLASEIIKDTTPYEKKDGKIYYGNPYDGFVGDMYDLKKNGYGVYHNPIAILANKYFDDNVLDLTGIAFDDVLNFISIGCPIWVITNVNFAPLEDEYFEMWHTPTGIVKITYKLHAVVITGYNSESIFINDPLSNEVNKKVDRKNFEAAWEQMGSQAVIINALAIK